jgi:hypothetical protein
MHLAAQGAERLLELVVDLLAILIHPLLLELLNTNQSLVM